ncbi:MAG TPA: hypothetical protein VEA99_10485 [Gemmatimonadaceae bacterium]|nr:hypothetical protein [Gemmatimonadaceae bacterium]
MFPCPHCRTPLGALRRGIESEVVCPRCRYKYQVTVGRLAARHDRSVLRRAPRLLDPGEQVRTYDLRLELARGSLETFQIEVPDRDDRAILVEPGDTVAIVYSMRGWRRETLVEVRNHTTGDVFQLARPGDRARNRAGCLAGLAALFAFPLAAAWDLPGPLVAILPIAVAGVLLFLLTKLFEPTNPEWADAPRGSDDGEAGATLLEQIHLLEGQRADVVADREEKLALRERLIALQQKMREVQLPVYAPRIEALSRAVVTLDEQIALDERLRDGYDRSITILEIEHEAGAAADALSGDVATSMQGRMAELRALEAEHAELGRRLEANVEIERFLRERSG